MRAQKEKIQIASNFNLNIKSGINWLELDSSISFNGENIDIQTILKKVGVNDHSIRLTNGKVGIIPSAWLKKIHKINQHIYIKNGQALLHPAKALLFDDMEELIADRKTINLRENLRNFKNISEVRESTEFNGELRPYQRLALGWFDFLESCHFGGILADDMGLGKTVQVIAQIQKRWIKKRDLKVLILCPKSLVGNWKKEFEKFAPELKVFNWGRKSLSKENYSTYNIIISSYQLQQRQEDFNFIFDYLILDEAQIVKNPQSKIHKSVEQIEARYKLALTGTPVENHIGDIMSICNVVIPGLFESKKIKDPSKLENINFLKPFILRRTKDDVLKDLPKKTIQSIYCEQGSDEKEYYLSYHYALSEELKNNDGIKDTKFNLLQVLTKMRQASCHLSLIDKNYKGGSCKLERLKDLVKEIHDSGNKVIIFSQFTTFLKLAKSYLGLDDENSCYLDGKTRLRDKEIEKFKESENHKSFFISIKAGGVGLNLINASYCIILDPWWNPATEAQAIDRIHRIGQKKPVFAYRLLTKGTIEEKVDELQSVKKELYERILSNTDGFIRELKRTDIEFLLS